MLNVLLSEAPENVAAILRFFAPAGGLLLDVSYGKGSLVSALPPGWRVVGSDLEGQPQVRAEWGQLPYGDSVADVVLYDPPYKVGEERYKFYGRPALEWAARRTRADQVIDHQRPVFEATRVLKQGGIFIAKLQNSRLKGKLIPHDVLVRLWVEEVGLHLRDVLVYIRLAVGVFRNKRTPQQAWGVFVVGEKV